MKTTIKILAVLVAMVGFSAASYAQTNTATATATGVILTPITISNVRNLNFGNIVSSGTIGTLTIAPTSAGTATAGGGASIATPAGSPTSAQFAVSGVDNLAFTVTVPTSDHTVKSGANTMLVNAFTTNTTGGVANLSSGSYTLYVGATLNVGITQPAGTYVSETAFNVTVNYQ